MMYIPRFSQDFESLTMLHLQEIKTEYSTALTDLNEEWNPDFAMFLKCELQMVDAWLEFRGAERSLSYAKSSLEQISASYDQNIEFRDKTRSRMHNEYR